MKFPNDSMYIEKNGYLMILSEECQLIKIVSDQLDDFKTAIDYCSDIDLHNPKYSLSQPQVEQIESLVSGKESSSSITIDSDVFSFSIIEVRMDSAENLEAYAKNTSSNPSGTGGPTLADDGSPSPAPTAPAIR